MLQLGETKKKGKRKEDWRSEARKKEKRKILTLFAEGFRFLLLITREGGTVILQSWWCLSMISLVNDPPPLPFLRALLIGEGESSGRTDGWSRWRSRMEESGGRSDGRDGER
jgi:hypothetical protein